MGQISLKSGFKPGLSIAVVVWTVVLTTWFVLYSTTGRQFRQIAYDAYVEKAPWAEPLDGKLPEDEFGDASGAWSIERLASADDSATSTPTGDLPQTTPVPGGDPDAEPATPGPGQGVSPSPDEKGDGRGPSPGGRQLGPGGKARVVLPRPAPPTPRRMR